MRAATFLLDGFAAVHIKLTRVFIEDEVGVRITTVILLINSLILLVFFEFNVSLSQHIVSRVCELLV